MHSKEIIKKPRNVTSNDVYRLWALFAQVYGSAMKPLGSEPPPVWRQELLALNIEQLDRGINEIKAAGENFPPGLFRFVRWCKHGSESDKVVRPSLASNGPPGYKRPALESSQLKSVKDCRAELRSFYGKTQN